MFSFRESSGRYSYVPMVPLLLVKRFNIVKECIAMWMAMYVASYLPSGNLYYLLSVYVARFLIC